MQLNLQNTDENINYSYITFLRIFAAFSISQSEQQEHHPHVCKRIAKNFFAIL